MGLFDFLTSSDINQGVIQCQNTPGAVLVDVRERDEYAAGHIPGSKNVPLSALSAIVGVCPDQDAPLFVYCLSGARSRRATAQLESMGYTQVTNLGGINRYRGELER
jgi:rhodanese-related sulfurtransferase